MVRYVVKRACAGCDSALLMQEERGGVLAMYHRYQTLCEKELVMGVGSLLGSSSREGEGEVQLPSGRQRLDGQIVGETTMSESS